MSELKQTLTEAKLTPTELKKFNSKTKEPRIDILKRLVTTSTPIELDNGKFIVVTDVQSAIDEINNFLAVGKAFPLTGKVDGKVVTISSSNLKKSDVFGGGKGSGGGSAGTALAESAQCYYCSAIVNVLGKPSLPEDFTEDVLRQSAAWVDASDSIDKVLSELTDDWIESSILSAIELYEKGFITVGMTFHRDSKLMNKIYNDAKLAFKQTGLSFKADKWNPGDIWAVAPGKENSIKFDISSVGALNDKILELFNNRHLVGISLKKVVKNASSKVFNGGTERPDYNPVQYSCRGGLKKISTFSSSTKVILYFNGGKAEGRSFNHLANWAFQIIGKNAAGGKVGLGAVRDIFKLHKLAGMPDDKALKKLVTKPNKRFLTEFYKMYLSIGDDPDNLAKDEFFEFVMEKSTTAPGHSWLWSKYIGISILYALKNSKDKHKTDAVVNDIILYAASNTSTSSAFVKVS
jgi:hypothetical protein